MNLGPGGKIFLTRSTTWSEGTFQSMILPKITQILLIADSLRVSRFFYRNEPVMGRSQVELLEQMPGWKHLLLCKKGHGKPTGICFAARHCRGDNPCGRTPGVLLFKISLRARLYQNLLESCKAFRMEEMRLFVVGLRNTDSRALTSIQIRRYGDVYPKELSGRQAEHAVRKYRSHRRVPN